MLVIIIKNNQVVKQFRKYFPNFIGSEIREWTNTHFVNAKEKVIDYAGQIRIYY